MIHVFYLLKTCTYETRILYKIGLRVQIELWHALSSNRSVANCI